MFQELERKEKYYQAIHVMGKLSELMKSGVLETKYSDPRIPLVNVHINNIIIPSTLISLGVATNIMTYETMETLGLPSLRKNPTMLQLDHKYTIKPKGILEDVIFLVDSWEYPTGFMILKPKTFLGGNPLILSLPCVVAGNNPPFVHLSVDQNIE